MHSEDTYLFFFLMHQCGLVLEDRDPIFLLETTLVYDDATSYQVWLRKKKVTVGIQWQGATKYPHLPRCFRGMKMGAFRAIGGGADWNRTLSIGYPWTERWQLEWDKVLWHRACDCKHTLLKMQCTHGPFFLVANSGVMCSQLLLCICLFSLYRSGWEFQVWFRFAFIASDNIRSGFDWKRDTYFSRCICTILQSRDTP